MLVVERSSDNVRSPEELAAQRAAILESLRSLRRNHRCKELLLDNVVRRSMEQQAKGMLTMLALHVTALR